MYASNCEIQLPPARPILGTRQTSSYKNAGEQEETAIQELAKKLLNPFVVYADVEANDVATNGEGGNKNSNIIEIERQYPASFGAIMVVSNC